MTTIKSQLFERFAKPVLVPAQFAGVDCFVRTWTERDRIEWAQHLKQLKGTAGDSDDLTVRCRAIAWSLCDADGSPIFERADFEKLLDFPATMIDPAFDAVMAVQQPQTADAKKNSATTPS